MKGRAVRKRIAHAKAVRRTRRVSGSPCCLARLVPLPLGFLPEYHVACSECRRMYVPRGDELAVCENPREHLRKAHREHVVIR